MCFSNWHTCSCLRYDQLWDKFLQDTGKVQPSKQQLAAALDEWTEWAYQPELELSEEAIGLFYGQECSVSSLIMQALTVSPWPACVWRRRSFLETALSSLGKMASTRLVVCVHSCLMHLLGKRIAPKMKCQILLRLLGLQKLCQLQGAPKE